jgi:4-methyl-5(b-hydroxyethyl)-thiazole monophosphate biosynthesis
LVALLLAAGFEEVEAITPADFLRRAGLDVRLVGIGGTEIEGSHGIVVTADLEIEELSEVPLAVVIPGGMPGAENIASSTRAMEVIRDVSRSGGTVAAICAAPAVVLQKTGILDGKRVTCYPGYEVRLENCRFVEDRVVVDGALITSRGAGTAAEFSIKLIEMLKGREAAESVHRKTLQR